MRAGSLLNRTLLTLMAGHFAVDLFSGVLPVTYPLLRERFALDLAATGLMATTFTAAASLSQPFFGAVADRFGSRYLASAAVAWMAIFIALYGFASSYGLLLLVAALAGLGSGAYHPQGAANASTVVPKEQINTAMSLYTIGGTSGFALGPLIGAALLALFGVRGTTLLLPFGLAVAGWLVIQLGVLEGRRPGRALLEKAATHPPIQWRPLTAVVSIVMFRSWVFLVLGVFTPILYQSLGYGPAFYSSLLFTMIICGSIGTFCGGMIADRIGRRPVIIMSLLLLGPAVWLYLAFPGPGAFLLGGLVGFISESSGPATLTMAQSLLPGRVGVASGLILGVGFVTGGIGVAITGAIADRIGLTTALMLLPFLLIFALLLTFVVPRDGRPLNWRRVTQERSERRAGALALDGEQESVPVRSASTADSGLAAQCNLSAATADATES